METATAKEKQETLDPDAQELLGCANNLDLKGVCLEPPCDDKVLTEAVEMVKKRLRILGSLVREIKKGEFKIFILNKKFDEERMIPGSITVMLSKNGEARTIYQQAFGAFFLQNSKKSRPDEESMRKTIAKLKDQINESLKQKQPRSSSNSSL